MAHRIGVVGASGYAGGELLRLLEDHPALELGVAAAHSRVGEDLGRLLPNMPDGARLETADADRLAELDLVFLATPHAVSLGLGGPLREAGTRVVDLSGAFRLDAGEFATWYGQDHPAPELTPAVYGLTEHHREAIVEAGLVANPGCYPSAALLGLIPLAGVLQVDSVLVDGKSGTSGAGRGNADHLQFSHVHADVTGYGAPGHRHTPEIERWVGAEPSTVGSIAFTPHLMPMARGLLTTSYGRLADGVDPARPHALLAERYEDEPFVHVLAEGEFPHTKAVLGSNACHLGVAVDPRTRRVVVTAAIDNLGKGAAGQALQNANLMLGCDEQLGLTATGIYP